VASTSLVERVERVEQVDLDLLPGQSKVT